jgi:hypothetical protein
MGTPNSECIIGHPAPRSESGRPRLTKERYINDNKSEYIYFFLYALNVISLLMNTSSGATLQSTAITLTPFEIAFFSASPNSG